MYANVRCISACSLTVDHVEGHFLSIQALQACLGSLHHTVRGLPPRKRGELGGWGGVQTGEVCVGWSSLFKTVAKAPPTTRGCVMYWIPNTAARYAATPVRVAVPQ